MSILRPACYKKFAHLIDNVYDRFERGTGQPKRIITEKGAMESFLTETVITALGEKATSALSPTTDLFSYGVDSLQATRIRNIISRSLELSNTSLGQNIVYEHPSISQLAAYLLAMGSGELADPSADEAHSTMLVMVDRWSAKLEPKLPTFNGHPKVEINGHGNRREVIVLTGATGSLGAHILYQLVRRDDVAKVICLSRATDDEESLKRVERSLTERSRTLSSEARAKIISFAADVNRPNLGLTPEQVEMLRLQSTAVIHNAWPVNFVLSIDSFDEHIGGAVNLLNLTLSSPCEVKPAFFFSSSVATRQGEPDRIAEETFGESPKTAVGLGYGRSKWVVEKICERASKSGARVGILRIGQLVGDTEQWVVFFLEW